MSLCLARCSFEVNHVLTRPPMTYRNVVLKCSSAHNYRRTSTELVNRFFVPRFTETDVFAGSARLRLFTVLSATLLGRQQEGPIVL